MRRPITHTFAHVPRHASRGLSRHAARGFTLIEMVVSIVIMGSMGSMIAMFIRAPILGYVDSVQRAELTDIADYSLRRIAREVRLALPNSLRVTEAGGVTYVEFIVTSGGGRYCNPLDGVACTNELSFTDATNKTFDVVGMTAAEASINANDYIVVYNLGRDSADNSYAPADAYAACAGVGCNVAQVSGVAGSIVTLASNVFAAQSPPLPSPSSRFHVVPGGVRAVTYACPAAPGPLLRYANYGFNAAQATPPAGGSSALLASHASCAITYANDIGQQRNGMLTIALTLYNEAQDEQVTLLRQIHLDNSP